MKKLFFAMFAMALFFSCEKSLTSEFNQEDLALTELTSNGLNEQIEALSEKANGGAQVIRYDGEWGFIFFDDETSKTAWVNLTYEEIRCGGERDREIIDIQDVIINEKDGTERLITLWKGQDVRVTVYDYDYGTCEAYTSAETIYEGTANFHWRDNNFGQVEEGDKNAWGFKLNGAGISINFHATYNGKDVKSSTSIKIK